MIKCDKEKVRVRGNIQLVITELVNLAMSIKEGVILNGNENVVNLINSELKLMSESNSKKIFIRKLASENITKMTTDDVYEKAKETYGADTQIDMCIEEMSELTKALLKLRRKEKGFDYSNKSKEELIKGIAEEVADVVILVEQVVGIYDIADEVDEIKSKKLERLEKRLKGEN